MNVHRHMENPKESEVITMSERDLYLMYLPQIAEMIVSCQQMTPKGYEQWKKETRDSTPDEAKGFMEKVFEVVDKHSGHQKAHSDIHMEISVCVDANGE